MKEKFIKYLNLENDKNLIGKRFPTECDIESFEQWKNRIRKNKLQLIIFTFLILIIVYGILFITGVFLEAELKSKIFGSVSLFIFGYTEYILIKKYLILKHWEIEYCTYGKVIDKYRMYNNSSKDYYVIVQVDDKKLKIRKYVKTIYWKLNISEDVLVFSIKGYNDVYVTKIISNNYNSR